MGEASHSLLQGNLPRSRDGTGVSHIADSLPCEPPGKRQKRQGHPQFWHQTDLHRILKMPSRGQSQPQCQLPTPPPSLDPWGPGPILAPTQASPRRRPGRAPGCPARISSGLRGPFVGVERNKLQAYGGGQGKVISIREGSPRSQANTDKLCNTGGRATGVIYPSRSRSAQALQDATLLPPPPPSRISHLFLAFEKKRETARVACCKISHQQGEGGDN